MKNLVSIPVGLEKIKEVFGDPDLNGDFLPDVDFIKKNIVRKKIPYPMRLSWARDRIVNYISGHKLVIDSMIDALTEIKNYKGYEWLKNNNLDIFGGTYHFRKMCGERPFLSTHSWGIAIDINPHMGEYGKFSIMPQFIIEAFENRGFIWGGRWKIPDGMHFQACKGY